MVMITRSVTKRRESCEAGGDASGGGGEVPPVKRARKKRKDSGIPRVKKDGEISKKKKKRRRRSNCSERKKPKRRKVNRPVQETSNFALGPRTQWSGRFGYRRRRGPVNLRYGPLGFWEMNLDCVDYNIHSGPEIQKRFYKILYPPEESHLLLGQICCALCNKRLSCRVKSNRNVSTRGPVVPCGCPVGTLYCSERCKERDRHGHNCGSNVKLVESNGPPPILRKQIWSPRYVTTREVRDEEVLTTAFDKPIIYYPTMLFRQSGVRTNSGMTECLDGYFSCTGCLRIIRQPEHPDVAANHIAVLPCPDIAWNNRRETEGYDFFKSIVYDGNRCKGCGWVFCTSLCAKGAMHPAKECRWLRYLNHVHQDHPLTSETTGCGAYFSLWWIPIVRILLLKESKDKRDHERYAKFFELPGDEAGLSSRIMSRVETFMTTYRGTIVNFVEGVDTDPSRFVKDIIVRLLIYGMQLHGVQDDAKPGFGFIGGGVFPFNLTKCLAVNSSLTMDKETLQISHKSIGVIQPDTYLKYQPRDYERCGCGRCRWEVIQDPFIPRRRCKCDVCEENTTRIQDSQ